MTRPEDEVQNINKKKEIQPPVTAQSKMAVILHHEIQFEEKQNVNADIIPFESNFEIHGDVSDVDLLSALCGVESSTNLVSKTSTVIITNNSLPCTMFDNCQIGTLNITIIKK